MVGTSAPSRRPRAVLNPGAWPWWVQTLALYALTRVWTTVVLVVAARGQPASVWADAEPGYWTFTGLFWDASWYRSIAEQGYPATLPVDAGGAVLQNSWAFFPLFPWLVRAVMTVTQGPWEVVAPLTATVLGAAAMLVIAELVESRSRARGYPRARSLALGTVLLVGLFPPSPVLQVAYTESLSLLLVAATISLLVRRRYAWSAVAVLALGLTRAVALPMAVVVAVHLLARWRAARAAGTTLARRDVLAIGGVGVAAVVAGVLWPVTAGLVTGEPDAYIRTQAAWRGTFSSAPFVPWVQMADYLFGPEGIIVLGVVVAVVLSLGLVPRARVAGPELQAWGVAYPLYLLAAIFPQSSTIRFLILAFPLGTATVALAPTRFRVALIAVGFAVGQWVWVMWLWQLTTATAWPP